MKNNWVGIDTNEISVREYGILLNEKENTLLYGTPLDEQLNEPEKQFLYIYKNASEDDVKEILKESYIKIDDVLNACGLHSLEEWNKTSLISKYDNLISYYGHDDILGTSYARKKKYYEDLIKLF